jgi:hypothetical protein
VKVPKLTKTTLVNTEVHLFIQYIQQLLRQEAFVADLINQFGSGPDQSMGEAGDEESTNKWLDLHPVILGQKETFQSGAPRDPARGLPTSHFEGCNRNNHKREDCKFRNHPDFNERGQLDGSVSDRAVRKWQKDEKEIKILMIEIIDDDVTMTVEIVMVIEEITEVVEVVEVVDKSIGIKTKPQCTPCLNSSITHLTCNCGGADINSTYRQCLVSMRNSTVFFTTLTLFDTGAYTSFVNSEVAKWLEQQQQHGGTVAGVHHVKSSRHDVPTFEVGLAGTQLSSSIYGTVVFDLTFFNEVTK